MKILVTGGHGTMGWALRRFLPDATYLSRAECDVANDRQLNEVFGSSPDIVVHAAAAKQAASAAEIIQTNIVGTELVARYCRAFGAKLVYLSTHYIYPCEAGDYRETDTARPVNTYAWSKLAGEGWARLPEKSLIIRGAWYRREDVAKWSGSANDAFCSRERTDEAAKKIAKLVLLDAEGVFNIGGKRRSFHQIAWNCEKMVTRPISRRDLILSFDFPADSSVNTDKYDAFVAT